MWSALARAQTRFRAAAAAAACPHRHGHNAFAPSSHNGIAVAETGRYMVLGVGQVSLRLCASPIHATVRCGHTACRNIGSGGGCESLRAGMASR